MQKIRYAVIGCGSRISGLIGELKNREELELAGGYDPSAYNTRLMLKANGAPEGKVYASYKELVGDAGLDWVLVGSPNCFHKEHIVAAFEAGKHVFAEKPLATTLEDCLLINAARKASGRLFATGFTLRYAGIYRKAKEILESRRLGKILSVGASENITPSHGAYIMRNWRRKREIAGPHILEKCVHDLDLLNWLCGSLPLRVAAFGGNGMFLRENGRLYREYPERFDQAAWDREIEGYDAGGEDPFTSDKTIEDHVSALMAYRNGVKVQFQATMSNTLPERRLYFHCTEGNLILELYSGSLRYMSLADEAVQEMSFVGGGHGDGDRQIMAELADSMRNGTVPVCGGREGLLSAVTAIAIDQARREGRIIDLSEVWERLEEGSPLRD